MPPASALLLPIIRSADLLTGANHAGLVLGDAERAYLARTTSRDGHKRAFECSHEAMTAWNRDQSKLFALPDLRRFERPAHAHQPTVHIWPPGVAE